MRAPVSHRFVRLLAALGLAGALLLPALAAPARAADEQARPARRHRPRISTSLNPYHTLLVVGYEVFQLTYNLLVDFGPNLEPVPGLRRQVGARRRREVLDLPDPRGDEVVGRHAGHLPGRLLLVGPRRRRDRRRRRTSAPATSTRASATPASRRSSAPTTQTMIAYTEDAVRPDPPDLRPDPPEAHLGRARTTRRSARPRSTAPLVGTGPYTLVEWKTSQFVRFVRNPEYWGTQGAADEVVIQLLQERRHDGPGAQGRRDRLRPRPEPRPAQGAPGRPGLSRRSPASANGWTQLAFNTYGTGTARRSRAAARRRRRCSDPAFRDALGYAVDKDAARRPRPRRLRRRRARRSSRRSSAKWHVEPTTPRTFDIELAKQKLDAAGYKLDASGTRLDKEGKPISLRLVHARHGRAYTPSRPSSCKDWYGQLGIKVTTAGRTTRRRSATSSLPPEACRGAELRRVQGRLRHRAVGLGVATRTRTRCSRSSAATRSASSSDSQYCNPEYDALYDAQTDAATTRSERKTILAEMQNLIYDEAPYDILFYDANPAAYRTDQFARLAEPAAGNGTPLFTYSTLQYTLLTDATAAAVADGRAVGASRAPSAAPTPAPERRRRDGHRAATRDAPVRRHPRAPCSSWSGVVLAVVFRRRSAGAAGSEEE